ncbi:thiopeptide-type bacteriocin biosynthesis protein [Chitinophaga sp.]|uniref:thiopeptide-type bacteriocin biosynthesis protein n=1 Tax=Chitinophaga sp. TaxID=1869181 RepID=UPI002C9C91CC|nr:thiopeptide-type bacteriocin biosynthesis protein [Chitinophaga sp.]HWV66866.1 thiopeptide-type bacteriocin biosynthesis protein [Chitinophaga sp.]
MISWLCVHLYYRGSLDELLTGCVGPFLDAYLHLMEARTPYFFIRYPQGGNHIRLRMHTRYHALLTALLQRHTQAALLPFAVHCRQQEYIPETARYGNEASIVWAENYFHLSSFQTMQWLIHKKPQAPVFAICQHMALLTLGGFSTAQQLALCNYFIDDWIRIFKSPEHKELIIAAFERLLLSQKAMLLPAIYRQYLDWRNDAGITAKLRNITHHYLHAGFSDEQLAVALTGMMHMTHNRLGIDNQEEAYIMYCCKACIQHIHEHERTITANIEH